ncbi:hypothetical protein ABEB36_014498 [Hypothenemus hampei]|uniref:Myb-like domain-containing protein n=1 Tax=Hypothenemus hampei TaxID=57062 RepID=A0ABD1E294_HYPHA
MDNNIKININDISEFLIIPHLSNTNNIIEQQQLCKVASQTGSALTSNGLLRNSNKEETNPHWTKDHSLILIDCYKLFRTRYILEKHNLQYTPANCENRWRVLERNYKKYIENNSQTGRGRKYFEFAEQMDTIFNKKRNVNPEILLTSSSVILNDKLNTEEILEVPSMEKDIENVEPNREDNTTKISVKKTTTRNKIKTQLHSTKYKKQSILEQMRIDRKHYQEESLMLKKVKMEQMLEMEKEKLNIKKRRNELR